MARLLPLVMLFAAVNLALSAPALTPDDIGTSARIPSVGHEVTYTVRLNTPADGPLAGSFRVTMRADNRPIAEQPVQLNLAAGQHQDVPLRWTPAQDGWTELVFSLIPASAKTACAQVQQTVPVTNRPLYFLWFGAPQRFKWCNVPTTVEPKDRDWWLWHGALPCAWKGGVCYKDWTTDQFTKSYDDTPWIAIDEVGPNDETGQKIIAAVRAHKQAHPDGCRALWYMGVHDYWRDVRDCVDLFVPEVYLNYGGNHLGKIDAYVRRTREVGCMDRMIPGLGINIIEDKDKKPTVVPTREDVLRQIRHLKTIAPELNGVGFFTSDSCAPGVAEYADELCATYYISPVLTLVPGSLQARAKGGALELSAKLRNDGGMTSRGVTVEFGSGYGSQFRSSTMKTVARLGVGSEADVTAAVPLHTGVHVYGVRLAASTETTTLNDDLWTMVARSLPDTGLVVWQPDYRGTFPPMPQFAPAPSGVQPNLIEELDSDGTAAAGSPAAVLPKLPGDPEDVVTWVPDTIWPEGPAAFQLKTVKVEDSDASDTNVERLDETLVVHQGPYRTELDLATDRITSVRYEKTEILGSPWVFNCTAYTGVQPAQLHHTPAGLLITIPFANPQAEGFSRYFCYRDAPVIRIERYFAPRAEMKVTGSSEGCGMPQRGGTFALQAGVGGIITRGQLHDSQDYRDLLFGYLGDGPGPENARLAGWFDCAFDGGGLGVAIERRWEAAHSDVGYDVTRYYDGGDWLSVLNLWGKELTVAKPQSQIVYLLPHGPMALDDPKVTPPAQALWNNLHARAQAALVMK